MNIEAVTVRPLRASAIPASIFAVEDATSRSIVVRIREDRARGGQRAGDGGPEQWLVQRLPLSHRDRSYRDNLRFGVTLAQRPTEIPTPANGRAPPPARPKTLARRMKEFLAGFPLGCGTVLFWCRNRSARYGHGRGVPEPPRARTPRGRARLGKMARSRDPAAGRDRRLLGFFPEPSGQARRGARPCRDEAPDGGSQDECERRTARGRSDPQARRGSGADRGVAGRAGAPARWCAVRRAS